MWNKLRIVVSSKGFKRILLSVLIGIWLVASMPFILNLAGLLQFKSNQYQLSHGLFSVSALSGWYDKANPLKNKADSSYKQNKFELAAKEYEIALDSDPKELECPIRYNWALSVVALASDAEAKDSVNAIRLYLNALRILTVKSCIENPLYSDKFKSLEQQINTNLKKISQKQQDSAPSNSSQNKQQSQDATKKIEDKLESNDQETEQQNRYRYFISDDQRVERSGGRQFSGERKFVY